LKRPKPLLVLLMLLIASATFVGGGASPADATPGCSYVSSRYMNAGVATASINLERCSDSDYVYGTITDTTCDARAAQLEIWTYNDWRRTGMEVREAPNGCGTSATFRIYVRDDFVSGRLWLRACNSWGCSSSATGLI
jgi:hypothetical protein